MECHGTEIAFNFSASVSQFESTSSRSQFLKSYDDESWIVLFKILSRYDSHLADVLQCFCCSRWVMNSSAYTARRHCLKSLYASPYASRRSEASLDYKRFLESSREVIITWPLTTSSSVRSEPDFEWTGITWTMLGKHFWQESQVNPTNR